MDIHVVRPGDTLYELAYQFGVPMSRLIQDNQLPDSQLVVGQTLVIQYPRSTYTVRSGDTLFSIARNAGVPLRQLLRNNPAWRGDQIYPDRELVLTSAGKTGRALRERICLSKHRPRPAPADPPFPPAASPLHLPAHRPRGS